MAFACRLKGALAAVSPVSVPSRSHTGYIPLQGRLGQFQSSKHRTWREYTKINLKPLKKVHFMMDPFHAKVKSIRHMMFYLSTEKVRNSNPKCFVKFEVMCDRSEPLMKVDFEDGSKLNFKTANLSTEDVMTLFNRYVLPKVVEEKEAVVESKGAKKAKGKK